MAVNTAQYLNQTNPDTRLPTIELWSKCPVLELLEDPNRGFYMFEDFGGTGDANVILTNLNYGVLEDTGVTHTVTGTGLDSTTVGGFLEVGGNDANQDKSVFQTAEKLAFDDCSQVYFECRIAVATPTAGTSTNDVGLAFFAGVADMQANVDLLANGTGLPTSTVNCVGFNCAEAAPTTVNFDYQDNGQTLVNMKAAAKTLTVDTYFKVGFVFDINRPKDEKMQLFVDGTDTALGTALTDSVFDAATTFPSADDLAVVIGTCADGTGAQKFSIDWVRAAFVRKP